MWPFRRIAKKEFNSKTVFFVRGYQRSGTNWVSNLLNLHQEVSCTGEFHFKQFYLAYKDSLERKYGLLKAKPDLIEKQFAHFIQSTVIDYNHKNALFVGDRTPMALCDLLIPNCKYVIIQRDGRDVLISWLYHLFRINHKFSKEMEQKKLIFMNDNHYYENNKLELLNDHWVKKIAVEWNYRILSDHEIIKSSEKHNIQTFDFKYEDLIQKTDEIRRNIYEFLGADLKLSKALNKLTTPGFKKLDLQSHYRKGESGIWKDYFSDEHIAQFENHAGEALKLLSYELYT